MLTAGCAGPPATPLERNGFTRLTSHAELLDFVHELDAASELVAVRSIGRSLEQREIPALFFSLAQPLEARRSGVLTALVSCQQHGNEPSGKEAALALARELAFDGAKLLRRMDLILVPQVNPDGGEAGTRENAADIDLNRNHVILSEPESRALHDLFLDWMPEVTLDVHETNSARKSWLCTGMIKDADEQLDGVTNLAIAPEIRRLAVEVVVPEVGLLVRQEGFTFHRYVVGGPPGERRFRHSTTDINDSRQSMGIYDTLSFIVEGKRYDDHEAHLERRTAGQLVALRAFLDTVASRSDEILEVVGTARAALLEEGGGGRPIQLRQDYRPDPDYPVLAFPIFDLLRWERREAEFDDYQPVVESLLEVERPWGYAIPPAEEELIGLMKRHRLEMGVLVGPVETEVERYLFEEVAEVTVEEKEADEVKLRVSRERSVLPAGTVVLPLRQPAAKLIPLLLEPQSLWGPFGERGGRHLRLEGYLQKGALFPVLRLLEPVAVEVSAAGGRA
jgi:hypothetical protein